MFCSKLEIIDHIDKGFIVKGDGIVFVAVHDIEVRGELSWVHSRGD